MHLEGAQAIAAPRAPSPKSTMPCLRITADDYGLCSGVNAGIEELAAQGAISAVSVMVHDGAALETAHRLGHLAVRTGLHLVFVEERPLSAPFELVGLLTPSGTLPRSYRDLFARLVLRPSLAVALAREARRQIERFGTLGLRLDFINSHQHTHMFPPVWHALRDLWSAWPASQVRLAAGGWASLSAQGALHLASDLSVLRGPRLPAHRQVFPLGISHAGALTTARVAAVLRRFRASALAGRVDAELVTHPGMSDDRTRQAYRHWRYHWEEELNMLRQPTFDETLAHLGFSREFGRPR